MKKKTNPKFSDPNRKFKTNTVGDWRTEKLMLPKKTSPQVVKCQTSEALTENGKVEFILYTNICTIILPTVLNLTYEMEIIRLCITHP